MQRQNHWKIPKPQVFQWDPESETEVETESRRNLRESREERSREIQGCAENIPRVLLFLFSHSLPDSVFHSPASP